MGQLSLLAGVEQRCRKCGVVQPLEAFNWANRAAGRRQTTCRLCFSEYNRTRYEAQGEQIKAAVRTRYWADPEKVRAEGRRSYAKHIDERRAQGREYQLTHDRTAYKVAWARADRAANPEKWREKSRREYRQNPLARMEVQWRRRAQKLATMTGPVTVALLRAKWSYWDGRCWICGGEAVEFDHVKPLAKGGAHMLCNLRPACRSCNAQKRDRWPLAA